MRRPKKTGKPLPQQHAESEAMLRARDRAGQTPDAVRKGFLERRRTLGPVFIEPLSVGILWLLEELKHPFNEEAAPNPDGSKAKLTMKDSARAIYIFHDSEGAGEAYAEGLDVFDREALQLMRGISPEWLPQISAELAKTIKEGLATIPGAGGSNPNGTGS